jgi:hypothetical protein
MKNNDDIPTTDTNEIKQLINRVKRGELDQGDALLIEKLLNILLMIVSLLQRKHTSIRRMKELLLGLKFFTIFTEVQLQKNICEASVNRLDLGLVFSQAWLAEATR